MNLAFFRALTAKPPKSSPTPSMYDIEFFEADPSPLTTQTLKFFEELHVKRRPFWETYCEVYPSEPECKVFDL